MGTGTLLYLAIAGTRPRAWQGQDGGFHQDEQRAESLREHRRVPAALAAIIEACLEPDPARRPTIDGLYDELDRFLLSR